MARTPLYEVDEFEALDVTRIEHMKVVGKSVKIRTYSGEDITINCGSEVVAKNHMDNITATLNQQMDYLECLQSIAAALTVLAAKP